MKTLEYLTASLYRYATEEYSISLFNLFWKLRITVSLNTAKPREIDNNKRRDELSMKLMYNCIRRSKASLLIFIDDYGGRMKIKWKITSHTSRGNHT
jgi:hypothetical protein